MVSKEMYNNDKDVAINTPHSFYLFIYFLYRLQSGESKSASISGSLALGDSGEGLSIKGNADNTIAAKSDLKAGKLQTCKLKD